MEVLHLGFLEELGLQTDLAEQGPCHPGGMADSHRV